MASRFPKPKLKPGEVLLKPVKPNAGIAASYRGKINKLVYEMNKSVVFFITQTYKRNSSEIEDIEPTKDLIAIDALPAAELQRAIRRLIARWQRQFDQAAPKLASWFARSASTRSDKVLADILRDGGFSVKFSLTRAQRNILRATINENVSLIRSIPARYLQEIEGLVMRSVTAGRDVKTLTKDIQARYKVTRKRAALIARDQNSKATAQLVRARQLEFNILDAVWMHSHAGKTSRPTHLANDGKRYSVKDGWFDPAVGKFIHPGELINCRCTSKSIVKGFS